MREVNLNEEEIKKRIKDHRDEQELKSMEKIKEYFLTGQIDSEVTIFTLRLLGIKSAKTKEIIKQWACEKTGTENMTIQPSL